MLADTRSPLSNNPAERNLRMVKDPMGGERPISQHRQRRGHRRLPETASKHGKNLLDALTELFTTGPWLPPAGANT